MLAYRNGKYVKNEDTARYGNRPSFASLLYGFNNWDIYSIWKIYFYTDNHVLEYVSIFEITSKSHPNPSINPNPNHKN